MKVYFKKNPDLPENEIQICAKEMTETVERVLASFGGNDFFIPIQEETGKLVVTPAQCITFYTSQKKVFVVTKEGEYTTPLRLYQLEENLPKDFVRISNTEIINLKEVERFAFTKSGIIEVFFKNGDVTSSSRRYLKRIKERFT